MQLFVLDESPTLSAQYLADVHVRKMCLETAQILSSVCFNNGIELLSTSYPKPYNPKHPVIQAIRTQAQINWVVYYNIMLQHEYYMRFGKVHVYNPLKIGYMRVLWDRTVAPNCSGLACDFKGFNTDATDTVEAHRDYYRHKKSIIKNWNYTLREEPEWLV
jgi:hypothetical protein